MVAQGWDPTITQANLKKRADLIRKIREFFHSKNILEVETPALSHTSVPSPVIHSFVTQFAHSPQQTSPLYLQTSPEFAMKRLLCAGSGSIYQICKAFRNSEVGHKHNPEFTMLEWYHVGFDHHALMHEVAELLTQVMMTAKPIFISYRDLFKKYCELDLLTAKTEKIIQRANHFQIDVTSSEQLTKDDWLNLLISHVIEPKLGFAAPTFIYDYPASQAALAKIRHDEYPVAERFELYIKGVELANGFHELADAKEQRERFVQENVMRAQQGLPQLPLDENLLQALEHGLPACAGVAVGIDRLLMIAMSQKTIQDVIVFPVERA